jgi:hypothetical protein
MSNTILLILLPFLIVLFVHLRAVSKFDRYARDAMKIVRTGRSAHSGRTADPQAIPEIVRAFAIRAGVPVTNPPLSASFNQLSEMRMNTDGAWMELHAEEVMGVREPGFVWYAEQKRNFFLVTRVVDAFVHDHGTLNVRLLGSLPLVDMAGPRTDEAELMRYLAELPWVPDALLHNPHLRWRQLEDDVVEVETSTAGTKAKVRFRFDTEGDIVEMQADERGRSEGKEVVMRPWRAYFRSYRRIEGTFAGETGFRRIPTQAEVGWILDQGYSAYWRGQIATYGLDFGTSAAR